ncbi:MAG: hypothetical protein AAFN18_06635 [Cyanobacteria bacterium J06554_6]
MTHSTSVCLALLLTTASVSPAIATPSLPSPSAPLLAQANSTDPLPIFRTATYAVRVFTSNNQPPSPQNPLRLNLYNHKTSRLILNAVPVQALGSGAGVAYRYIGNSTSYLVTVPNYSAQKVVSIQTEGQAPRRELEVLPPISETRFLFHTDSYAVRVFKRENRPDVYLNLYNRDRNRLELNGVPITIISSDAERAYLFSNAGADYSINEIVSHPQKRLTINYKAGAAAPVNELEIVPPISSTELLFDTDTYAVRVYRRQGQAPLFLNVYNRNTNRTELLGVAVEAISLPDNGMTQYVFEYETIGYRITQADAIPSYEILLYDRVGGAPISEEKTDTKRA